MNTKILLFFVLLSLFLSETVVAQEIGIDIIARHPGEEEGKFLNVTTEFEPEASGEDYTLISIMLAVLIVAIVLLVAYFKRIRV